MDDFLRFDGLAKVFGTTRAVNGVSLSIKRGEIFSLLGPSGCGKTTLLRMLAGFEQPDKGRIILDGQDITDLPPNHRKVNTVFQNYALFPHMTVRENIAYGLKVAHKPKDFINSEVDRMLSMIQMQEHASKKPSQISGGQKQRTAIARALIMRPDVLLLDEPLAALDLKLRQKMLLELSLIHDEVGVTFIYVTHDQGEAMSISDRIAVMNNGRIEQIGRKSTGIRRGRAAATITANVSAPWSRAAGSPAAKWSAHPTKRLRMWCRARFPRSICSAVFTSAAASILRKCSRRTRSG